MKYSLISLGCPKNQVDSENLLGRLGFSGHDFTDLEEADVILINTCSFIESAKAESVETILDAVSTGKRVLVMGCLPARYMRELKQDLPEVEAFFGVGEEERILQHLGIESPVSYQSCLPVNRSLLNPSHYAYLKVAEGCDNRCTYCAIPSIRGPYISRAPDLLVAEAEKLAKNGVKELIIVAQDTTAYGKDLRSSRPDQNLEGLLRILSTLGFRWIRIMYAYPDAITESLLDLIRSTKNICTYLDIPLQHSEPSVLLRMGRRRSEVVDPRHLVEKIRGMLPDVVIRSSFIVGFPGETEKEFEGLLDFIQETELERVGAFMFSKEEGTPAAAMTGQVPEGLIKERLDRLMGLQAEISYKRGLKSVGSVQDVLIDECDGNTAIGRTSADAPEIDCNVIVRSNLSPGDFVKVRITEAQDYDLIGSLEVESQQETGIPNMRKKLRHA